MVLISVRNPLFSLEKRQKTLTERKKERIVFSSNESKDFAVASSCDLSIQSVRAQVRTDLSTFISLSLYIYLSIYLSIFISLSICVFLRLSFSFLCLLCFSFPLVVALGVVRVLKTSHISILNRFIKFPSISTKASTPLCLSIYLYLCVVDSAFLSLSLSLCLAL